MSEKTKIIVSAQAPIVKPGDIDLKDVVAVIFRNAGDATVNLWGGMYTLDSKETLSLNVTEDWASIDLLNIPISFDTSTGAVQKLQWVVMKPITTKPIC